MMTYYSNFTSGKPFVAMENDRRWNKPLYPYQRNTRGTNPIDLVQHRPFDNANPIRYQCLQGNMQHENRMVETTNAHPRLSQKVNRTDNRIGGPARSDMFYNDARPYIQAKQWVRPAKKPLNYMESVRDKEQKNIQGEKIMLESRISTERARVNKFSFNVGADRRIEQKPQLQPRTQPLKAGHDGPLTRSLPQTRWWASESSLSKSYPKNKKITEINKVAETERKPSKEKTLLSKNMVNGEKKKMFSNKGIEEKDKVIKENSFKRENRLTDEGQSKLSSSQTKEEMEKLAEEERIALRKAVVRQRMIDEAWFLEKGEEANPNKSPGERPTTATMKRIDEENIYESQNSVNDDEDTNGEKSTDLENDNNNNNDNNDNNMTDSSDSNTLKKFISADNENNDNNRNQRTSLSSFSGSSNHSEISTSNKQIDHIDTIQHSEDKNGEYYSEGSEDSGNEDG